MKEYVFTDVDGISLKLETAGYGPANVVGQFAAEDEDANTSVLVYVTRKQARKLGRKLFELAAKGE